MVIVFLIIYIEKNPCIDDLKFFEIENDNKAYESNENIWNKSKQESQNQKKDHNSIIKEDQDFKYINSEDENLDISKNPTEKWSLNDSDVNYSSDSSLVHSEIKQM